MAKKKYYGGMISEDRGSMANMPQNVVIKKYPNVYPNAPEGLNDTISGIDSQIKDDSKRKKPINSEKY